MIYYFGAGLAGSEIYFIRGFMTIRVVLSDFGGVLVRTEDNSFRISWEKKLGLRPGELSRLVFDNELAALATVGQASEDKVWEYVGMELRLNLSDLLQLRKDFWAGDCYDSALAGFLSSLRPRYKAALLSNAWPGARELFTGKFHLDRVMDVMFISAELGLGKPDPRIYQAVIDSLKVKPGEILFIDDVETNIIGAQAVGIQAIQFRDSSEVIEQVKGLLGL